MEHHKKISHKDLFIILFLCIIYATHTIFVKQVLNSFSPFFFVAIRFFIVGLCALPFCRRKPPEFKSLALLSFIFVVIGYGVNDIGFKLNDSIIVISVLSQCSAITCIIGASIFLKEKLTKFMLLGMTIAFCGIALLVSQNIASTHAGTEIIFNQKNLISTILIFIALWSWPVYLIFLKKVQEKITAMEIIAWTGILGSIQCFIISLIFENNQWGSIKAADSSIFFEILYTSLCGTLLTNVIWHYLLKKYPINQLSPWILIVPVITAIQSVIFYDEKITMMIIFGSFLTLLGIYITDRKVKLKVD